MTENIWDLFVSTVIRYASALGWWGPIVALLVLAGLFVVVKSMHITTAPPPKPYEPVENTPGTETPGGGPGDEWLKTHPQPPPEETGPGAEWLKKHPQPPPDETPGGTPGGGGG
jgi:hypothetical protein